MAEVKEKGTTGEELVAEYLLARGYSLVARNYHSRYGEIDLIVKNQDCLAFVEVKARGDRRLSAPREAVTPAKQKRIVKTAETYLSHCPTELQPRFDVAEVYLSPEGTAGWVEYFEDAFF